MAETRTPRLRSSDDVWAGDGAGDPWPRVESMAALSPMEGGGAINALALALFQLRAEMAELRAARAPAPPEPASVKTEEPADG